MVAGFFASIIIFSVMGKAVAGSILVYQASVTADSFLGPITVLAFIVLIITVMIVFAHKVFGLITHLPENVTKWIGGQATSLGERDDEARIRGMAVVGGRGGSRAAAGAVAAMTAGGEEPGKPGGGKGFGGGGEGGGKGSGGGASESDFSSQA